jgi:hypothetical protein
MIRAAMIAPITMPGTKPAAKDFALKKEFEEVAPGTLAGRPLPVVGCESGALVALDVGEEDVVLAEDVNRL